MHKNLYVIEYLLYIELLNKQSHLICVRAAHQLSNQILHFCWYVSIYIDRLSSAGTYYILQKLYISRATSAPVFSSSSRPYWLFQY